ncbi:hypothetical protein OC846_002914 [Tilletia horrida]|uniref:Uncharacterized protein n=1 Tax=Tilletia horrida TaxID=155126 RepID=A0AAN6JS81_9BASI|nr:hypothetical protein OC845_004363 [Tilletia horrida]KAK0552407.1 hypothetical protein OC846_002914 [Tilletia horrida]KAK0562614.1 hypothetical protein OC861_005219 [Tilletia horrida]
MTLPSAIVSRSAATVASSSRSSSVLARRVPAAAPASSSQAAAAARAAGARSYASVSPSVSDPKLTSKLPQGNDSLWAISSVVVFGGLFFYLTSPKKAAHGVPHSREAHSDHAPGAKEDQGTADEEESESESGVDFVVVEEPQVKISTPGHEVLQTRLTEDHGKQVSANNKAPPLPNKGETFKHGIAAAKDGDHISNPKAVVAASHEEKAAKYNSDDGKKGTRPDSVKQGVGSVGKGAKVEDAEDEE